MQIFTPPPAKTSWPVWLLALMCSLLPLGRVARAQSPPACATTAPTCNLIWNGGFEQTKNGDCPDRFGGFGNLIDASGSAPSSSVVAPPLGPNDLVCKWQDGNAATADLLNVCSIDPRMDVPCNWATGCGLSGYATTGQPTHLGNGYAGIYGTGDFENIGYEKDWREYLGQDMSLTAGKRYYVEYYAAIAALSDWSVANLGVAFAPTTTQYTTKESIALTPVAEKPVGIVPGSWTLVNGFFQATGLEQRLLIGNFGPTYSTVPGAPLPYINNGPSLRRGGPLDRAAYYFIDDALLLPVPTAGPNISVCGGTVQLGECPLPASSGASYAWSPTTGLSNPGIANPVLTPSTAPGTYTYTLTVTIPGQSPQITSTTITVFSPLSISASRSSVCLGGAVTLTASGGDGSPINWSPMTNLVTFTANSITVVPASTTTYTASSGCGTPVTFTVTVNTDCCLQNEVSIAADLSGTYSSYAFQAGQYYRVPANTTVTLTSGTFTLTNVTLLMGQNAQLKVDNGAQLKLVASTVTAACDQMWGSIRVTNTAGGMSTAPYGGRDCRIMHSIDGVVYEQDYGAPYAYFRFSQTHFRQNLRSITIQREGTMVATTDRISNCTFDSEPSKFFSPYKNMGYYSEWHLGVRGNMQAAYIATNDFKRAFFGVYVLDVAHPDVTLKLTKNTFADCWLGGVYAPNGQSIVNSSTLTLTDNTFTFPAAKTFPATAQTTSVQASYTNGAPAETYGAYMRYGSIVADNNRFQQLDSTQTVLMTSYDNFGQYRPRQTGLYALRLPSVLYNRFYLLDTGINVLDVPAGQQTTMQGNGFANCRVGIVAATQSTSAQLYASCNTFRRDNSRSGTSTGIALNLPSYSYGGTTVWPQILIRDFRSVNTTYPLRNLFDDSGVNSTINFPAKRLVALSNNSPAGTGQYTLNYTTFYDYYVKYFPSPWVSANVLVGHLNYLNVNASESRPNITNGPCRADGFPAAGIQQPPRQSNTGVTPEPAFYPQLAQNSPNPCSGSTTVHYQLPTGTPDAYLLVRRSTDGRTVQRVALDAATTQQELSLRGYEPGVYFATLLVGRTSVQTIRILVK
ncbi:hypothetical protein Q5H93_09135 [Hymenobacter sp. ASUV-10]|uniref:T9SS type A sorting domain-containing protein n=1 Tax=Hymenobacter aranciens TaxID=3063996 RepID=A0ABT9B9L6_9BACT|nr:hypothetical protein [Hymenobacter sp. ASUV-10]MDO7874893.1 hypothetical protein [Hymenobacter sp. ASUV-10]